MITTGLGSFESHEARLGPRNRPAKRRGYLSHLSAAGAVLCRRLERFLASDGARRRGSPVCYGRGAPVTRATNASEELFCEGRNRNCKTIDAFSDLVVPVVVVSYPLPKTTFRGSLENPRGTVGPYRLGRVLTGSLACTSFYFWSPDSGTVFSCRTQLDSQEATSRWQPWKSIDS
nr:hypothetical protein CFP56_25950 [Quercus suber]